MHPQIGIHPYSTRGWTLEQDLALYADLGVQRISVSVEKLATSGSIEHGAKLVASSGLTVDFILPARRGVPLDRRDDWPALREAMLEGLEVGRTLGAKGIYTSGGSGRGMLWEAAVEAFGQLFAPLFPALQASGMRFVLEPVRPQFAHLGFVHTLRDGVELARRFGIGLAFDTVHCWWEPDLRDTLATNAGLVDSVQLGDLDFGGPLINRLNVGDGQLPIADLIAPLREAGYRGPFELELTGPAFEAEGFAAALRRGAAALDAILSAG